MDVDWATPIPPNVLTTLTQEYAIMSQLSVYYLITVSYRRKITKYILSKITENQILLQNSLKYR